MRRLLLVTHRDVSQPAGQAARWRSLVRRLPAHGWHVDVVSAPVRASAVEYGATGEDLRRAALRARVMSRLGALADPAFGLAGLRPEVVPLSMAWAPRGARDVRRKLASGAYDAVLATAPPHVAMIAARLAQSAGPMPPLVLELRDLWAGSPAFDRGGPVLPAIERRLFAGARAIVVMTPEAAADVRARHPQVAERVQTVPNGFEPDLLARRATLSANGAGPLTVLHSGTLSADRPLEPLLRVLASREAAQRVRLVLHGHLSPETRRELAAHPGVPVEVVPPSGWDEAVDQIARADVTLVTQARGAGDATAVASKAYEYLALGKPVLAITDGGATEALLHRLGAGRYAARLSDEASIRSALERVVSERGRWTPPEPAVLAPYGREEIARRMATLLDDVVA